MKLIEAWIIYILEVPTVKKVSRYWFIASPKKIPRKIIANSWKKYPKLIESFIFFTKYFRLRKVYIKGTIKIPVNIIIAQSVGWNLLCCMNELNIQK